MARPRLSITNCRRPLCTWPMVSGWVAVKARPPADRSITFASVGVRSLLKKRSLAGIFTRACWRWASDSWTTLAFTWLFIVFDFLVNSGLAGSDHHQQHGNEDAAGGEGHGPRRPGVEPTLKAGQIAGQFGVLAGPGLLIKAEEHVDLHQRAHDLVVIENQRVGRADLVAGARQQQGEDQAGDADPQQVGEDEGAAVLESGNHRYGQAEQG